MGRIHFSEYKATFFRSSNKDNRHREGILPSMKEKWWESEETDNAAVDDSGSNMNDESLGSPLDKGFGETDHEELWWMPESNLAEADEDLDKDFISEPIPLTQVLGGSLFLGSIAVFFLSIPFMLMDAEAPIPVLVCCGIPSLLGGALFGVMVYDRIHRPRLRVQHTRDRLVLQELVLGTPVLFERRRLSEAVYLEKFKILKATKYVIRGRSSEGKEWKLDVTGLVFRFGNPRKKARQIAKAIGIEFRIE